ncbi:hypothetical protein [Paraburkholderia hayleyella]|uniref:hypothetical protein n=1 Tax=Paraburkholderia hayleyella TaxID=2152889 RepID=UPI0012912450|nr:hypothetical protein [Paraburkholderia hayleyella]
MSEIETLAGKVVELLDKKRAAIPLDVDLWDIRLISGYLKRSENYVRNVIVNVDLFPRPIRLPNQKGGIGSRLWRARDVILWAESHVVTK